MATGTLKKSFFREKGYGFIAPDEAQQDSAKSDIFVHFSAIQAKSPARPRPSTSAKSAKAGSPCIASASTGSPIQKAQASAWAFLMH